MFAIYLIVMFLVWGIGFYYAGKFESSAKGILNDMFSEDVEILWFSGVVGVLWPLVLTLATIFAPFIFIYHLGAKSKKKAKKTVD